MYRQQSVQRSVRDSWHVLDKSEEQATSFGRSKATRSRRSSAPITIFSADEGAEIQETSLGILPAHVGGVFAHSKVAEVLTQTSDSQLPDNVAGSETTDSQAQTSMSAVLEEVLESVDATTEMHQRVRSNSRIEDWLGEQSEIHDRAKRKMSQEEQQRTRKLTEGIMRDLLGVDQSVLNILFRSKQDVDKNDEKSAAQIEAQIWKRWIELARRDTASLKVGLETNLPADNTPGKRRADTFARRTSLERIPWGVPEDPQDDNYWNEELSLPMIFKYLKSRLLRKTSESQRATRPREEERLSDTEQPRAKHVSSAHSHSTQTEESMTPTALRSIDNLSTVPPSAVSRQTLARLSGIHKRITRERSKSRTSRSSSFRTLSQTGTCSVASMKRSALGSNFWDLGSLGGASVHSRQAGNWSVY